MLTLTESAQTAVRRFIDGNQSAAQGLRVQVSGGGCSGLQYGLDLVDNPAGDDLVVDCGAVRVFVDPISAQLLDGVTVDFVDGLEGSGFKFVNPNASACCGCGKSFSA